MTNQLSRSTIRPLSLYLILFLALVIFARFTLLTTSPPGFYVDEASIAYNAYTIATTGLDEHHCSFPVFFQAFGEFKSPLYIYSHSLLLQLLPPSILTSRLTSALWGLAALGIFFLLAHTLTHHFPTSLLATIFLATNPIHFLLSRVTFEIFLFSFFLYRFSCTRRPLPFFLFVITLALSFYSYSSAKLLAPALFLAAIISFFSSLRPQIIALSFLIFILILTPAIRFEIHHPGALSSHYHIHSVFTHHPLSKAPQIILENYASHFSPSFLFSFGDQHLRHSPAFHSIFFWTLAPFLFLGIIYHLFKLSKPFSRWLLFALFLSPLPAALTIQSPHTLRSYSLLIFGFIISLNGLRRLFRTPQIFITTIIFLALESILFIHYFFSAFPEPAQIWFDTTAVSTLTAATQVPGPYFFPSRFHPGLSTTWLFLRSTPLTTQTNSVPQDTTYRSSYYPPFANGTYLFATPTCSSLAPTFLASATRIYHNPDYCLYYLAQ